jgi:hypothetical protein
VQAVLDKIRAAGNPEYWQTTPPLRFQLDSVPRSKR